ncbi:predicted protein [Nematostella vectensis]|uniref:Uncharacterized protein n=1 Tax=Nematostella vectensis TaxID=45351 RepID=A7RKA0_NEMVE|nr:predicted protein [Nematostella vectensis]|eukprot:XP_001640272.1 predicted protein [Nematostella vectensis]
MSIDSHSLSEQKIDLKNTNLKKLRVIVITLEKRYTVTARSTTTIELPWGACGGERLADVLPENIRKYHQSQEFRAVGLVHSLTDGHVRSMTSNRIVPRGASQYEGLDVQEVVNPYYWQRIAGTDWTLCVVIKLSDEQHEINFSNRPRGPMVPMSFAIYKGNPSNVHSPSDDVMAVMGADCSVFYLKSLLLDSYPTCQTSSCFIMDSSCFLVLPESFIPPLTRTINAKDVELVHVTQRDGAVSKSMINNGILVREKYHDLIAIKTLYGFSVSVRQVVGHTTIDGFHYEVHPIERTNLYLGRSPPTFSKACFNHNEYEDDNTRWEL